MVSQKYRWDFIGLSTDEKPTSETSDKVVNGSTYYCSDTSKLYVYCDGTWYERKPLGGGGGGGTSDFNELTNRPKYNGADMTGSTNIPEVVTYSDFTGTDGTAAGTAGLVPAPATTDAGKFLKADGTWDTAGGGGGPTVVQTTGTSTTDVMSQNAVTSMVFADPVTQNKIKIGHRAKADGSSSVALGGSSRAQSTYSIALGANSGDDYTEYEGCISIGRDSKAKAKGAVALGIGSGYTGMAVGEMHIGTNNTAYGYNSSNYRLLTGLYDGQSAHDAATVAQGNTLSTSAPTTSTVGVLGQLYTDTTNMHTYQCTAISGGTYTWTQRW